MSGDIDSKKRIQKKSFLRRQDPPARRSVSERLKKRQRRVQGRRSKGTKSE